MRFLEYLIEKIKMVYIKLYCYCQQFSILFKKIYIFYNQFKSLVLTVPLRH
jgi:hypothetical protein